MIFLLGAAPLGIATGIAAWLLAGGASADVAKLHGVEHRLTALRRPPTMTPRVTRTADELAAMPLFAMTTGPNAVSDPSVRLDGISKTAHRTAALLSVDGKPADWLLVGEARDGVILRQVSAAGVQIDTPTGPKQIALGDANLGSSAPSPPAQAVADTPPPGFRSPPPPASAPPARK